MVFVDTVVLVAGAALALDNDMKSVAEVPIRPIDAPSDPAGFPAPGSCL